MGMSPSVRHIISTRQFSSTLLVALALIPAAVRGQEVLSRKPGESIETFANRVLPPNIEMAHKVLIGSFGPSSNNILLLFRGALDTNSNYTGWVLIPQDDSVLTELVQMY